LPEVAECLGERIFDYLPVGYSLRFQPSLWLRAKDNQSRGVQQAKQLIILSVACAKIKEDIFLSPRPRIFSLLMPSRRANKIISKSTR